MKEKSRSKKFLINIKGDASVGIVLLIAVIITFVLMPVFAFTFDKSLVSILSQDIVDEMELLTLKVFPALLHEDLSEERIDLSNQLISVINLRLDNLTLKAMIEELKVEEVQVIKEKFYKIKFQIKLSLKPSLYRNLIQLPKYYQLYYCVELPIDN